jgi:hypothetical protein
MIAADLIVYGLYLLFMLKTHPEFFAAAGGIMAFLFYFMPEAAPQ